MVDKYGWVSRSIMYKMKRNPRYELGDIEVWSDTTYLVVRYPKGPSQINALVPIQNTILVWSMIEWWQALLGVHPQSSPAWRIWSVVVCPTRTSAFGALYKRASSFLFLRFTVNCKRSKNGQSRQECGKTETSSVTVNRRSRYRGEKLGWL